MIVRETIILEGKSDQRAVQAAFESQDEVNCIITRGWGLNESIEERIRFAYETCGIIILTDPDYAGEKIRARLADLFPDAKHAFISADDAVSSGNVGVENASGPTIREALDKARMTLSQPTNVYTLADLYGNGLTAQASSAQKRNSLGRRLGIGYANAKVFLKRLNAFDIRRQDWEDALADLEENLNE